MKYFLSISAAIIVAMPLPAKAGEKTPPEGMPFCIERDSLQEYMMAAIKHDEAWMKHIKGCVVFKGDVPIGIIEDYPSDSLIGHVAKLRVMLGGTSVVGYGLMLSLENSK